MFYFDIDTEDVSTEEENTDDSMEISTTGDAYLVVSQTELNKAVEALPKLYDLFSFWFLVWLSFAIFTRIRKQIQYHTSEMRDKK